MQKIKHILKEYERKKILPRQLRLLQGVLQQNFGALEQKEQKEKSLNKQKMELLSKFTPTSPSSTKAADKRKESVNKKKSKGLFLEDQKSEVKKKATVHSKFTNLISSKDQKLAETSEKSQSKTVAYSSKLKAKKSKDSSELAALKRGGTSMFNSRPAGLDIMDLSKPKPTKSDNADKKQSKSALTGTLIKLEALKK